MPGQVAVAMDCPMCKWPADYTARPIVQWDYMGEHHKNFHDKRRNPMAPTIIQQLWLELDNYMKQAMEWEGAAADPNRINEVQTQEELCDFLENMVDKTAKTAAGRGLAIAIQIASHPYFQTSDEVVMLAMERYQASVSGQEMPPTPGFTDTAIPAAQEKPQPVPEEKPAPAPKKSGTQTVAAPAPAVPVVTPPSNAGPVDPGIVASIKSVHASGFSVIQIAQTFKIGEEQVKEVLGMTA
ncbi:hypothetical protein SEA_JUMBO_74 [Gordonia phage Jumbo]|uniref:Uncharacterized protein n=1 Tax=Gordonia phage Jumbo TaxID=1887650 RepID=A0A1B3B0Q9_9CAUD|nr:HTH DNA binding domain protein [Gordonia phage Jumbo]AOE44582.1 hypothetical protein SEA_JUMBO_74 [Gordonia phage Jumbo]